MSYEESRLFFIIAAGIYCLATLLGVRSIVREANFNRRSVSFLLLLGLFVQSIALWQRSMIHKSCPIANPTEILQFITWILLIIGALVGPAFRKGLLGLFVAAMATCLALVSLLIASWDLPAEGKLFGGHPIVETHASLALTSYGIFAMLALTSSMYLLQSLALKRKWIDPFYDLLPSIIELERINYRLLSAGTLLFSFALSIGFIFWLKQPEVVTGTKLFFAVLAWSGYICAFILRISKKLLANRLAWTSILLFFWALLTLWPVEQNRPIEVDQKVEAE